MNRGFKLLFDREVLKSILLSFRGQPVLSSVSTLLSLATTDMEQPISKYLFALNIWIPAMERLEKHASVLALSYRVPATPTGISWLQYFHSETAKVIAVRSDLPQDLKQLAHRLSEANAMIEEVAEELDRRVAKASAT
ncbi:MAG: hypothetical protein WCW31_04615 [Patescibacteria group bacterium]|jgi:hypothetical protein